jgi:hypothetical protein
MRYLEHALAHGIARHRAGHLKEARSVYESLLSLSMDPNICAVALANLSALHESLGHWVDARMASTDALNIDARNGVAILSAIRCDRHAGRPQKGLDRLSAWPTYALPPDLIHEMAMCYDALGQTTKAYHSFREANRRSSFENLDVDRTLVTRYMERMFKLHREAETEPWPEAPPMDRPDPIFIVGFNECGGNELAQLLEQHPSFSMLRGVPALDAARKSLMGRDMSPLGLLTNEDIITARGRYFETAEKQTKTTARVIDALPLNVLSLPLLYRLFPDSCIIRMVRHPIETVFQAFMRTHRVNAVTCHLDSMSRCAQLFLAATTIGEHFRDVLDIPMLDIRYEDFREAPDLYAQAIANSVDEEWRATNHLPASSPIEQWRRYKSDLEPWTKDLVQMATAQGYPAK